MEKSCLKLYLFLSISVPQKKEKPVGLEKHNDEQMMTEFKFLVDLSFNLVTPHCENTSSLNRALDIHLHFSLHFGQQRKPGEIKWKQTTAWKWEMVFIDKYPEWFDSGGKLSPTSRAEM